MRYSVFFKKEGGKKTCVYNTMSPDLTLALMNPKVHLAADSAGTFECSLNPNSPGIPDTVLERMATKVMVEEHKDVNGTDNKIIFYGRVLSIDEDFYNTPSLYCEGAYSFFNDTVIMPGKNLSKKPSDPTQYATPLEALQEIIGEHNIAVTEGGIANGIIFSTTDMIVTMKDDLFSQDRQDGSDKKIDDFIVETYTKTLDVLDSLKKTFGGHFRVRYRYPTTDPSAPNYAWEQTQMAVPILDWIEDMYKEDGATTKTLQPTSYIRFGENLLDFSKKRDGANIVNCLFLTGKKINSKGNTVIGREIDIVPMCYYWKLDKNGNPWDPNYRSTTYDTWDAAHYPLHDPASLNDLYDNGDSSSGNPKDTDMSHVYHIGNAWYSWNPVNDEYFEISSDRSHASNEEFQNGDVIRHYDYIGGTDPGHPWSTARAWSASSQGLATGFKSRIIRDPETQVLYYGEQTYIATGYWNSLDCGYQVDDPVNELDVFAGEKYYLKSNGYEGSYLQIFATGTVRGKAGNATIISTQVASTGGTKNEYSVITVPTPIEQLQSSQMHLTISSRHGFTPDDDGGRQPETRTELNTNLFAGRTPAYDEYITLWGLADGTYNLFLTTVEVTSDNGQKVNKTVLKKVKSVKENAMGVEPGSTDEWFLYPKAETGKTVSYHPNEAAILAQEGNVNNYYVNLETADVYTWTAVNGFAIRLDHRAYRVDSYMVTDDPSTKKYGRVEKIVNFANCEDPEALKVLGAKALFEAKLESFEVNVTALDLSLLETNIQSPDILDPIKIYSEPHKTDIILPLSERDIPLNDPASQQFNIGYQGAQKISKTYSWIRK